MRQLNGVQKYRLSRKCCKGGDSGGAGRFVNLSLRHLMGKKVESKFWERRREIAFVHFPKGHQILPMMPASTRWPTFSLSSKSFWELISSVQCASTSKTSTFNQCLVYFVVSFKANNHPLELSKHMKQQTRQPTFLTGVYRLWIFCVYVKVCACT